MTAIRVPMSSAMQNVTLEVVLTGKSVARVRLWLGIRLMMFAAWIIGCRVDVAQSWDEGAAPTSPPSRLSVNDPGYDVAIARLLVVTLDGEEQHMVIAYDVPAGTVTRYKACMLGATTPIVDEGETIIETVRGKVEAMFREDVAPVD